MSRELSSPSRKLNSLWRAWVVINTYPFRIYFSCFIRYCWFNHTNFQVKGRQFPFFPVWSFKSKVENLNLCSFKFSISGVGWLVGWLAGWLVGRIGWLVGWLADELIYCQPQLYPSKAKGAPWCRGRSSEQCFAYVVWTRKALGFFLALEASGQRSSSKAPLVR